VRAFAQCRQPPGGGDGQGHVEPTAYFLRTRRGRIRARLSLGRFVFQGRRGSNRRRGDHGLRNHQRRQGSPLPALERFADGRVCAFGGRTRVKACAAARAEPRRCGRALAASPAELKSGLVGGRPVHGLTPGAVSEAWRILPSPPVIRAKTGDLHDLSCKIDV
jgi:hypothetical protein